MKHIVVLTATLLLFCSALFAQQENAFIMYRYHMNMVNPSYAGVDGETLFTTSIRKQWTGIKDAPETQAVSFGTVVGRNLGMGISVVMDKTFIEKKTLVGIDFSYKLKWNQSTDLYLGIKAGGNFYDVNTSGLQTNATQLDPALNAINHFNPNVGFGALLKHEKYFVSLSIPRLLSTERAQKENGIASVIADKPQLNLSGGYDLSLSPEANFVVKPSFMLRYISGAPVSLAINSMLQIHNNFEIGATYRTEKAFAGLVDFTISKRLMIGYGYEVSTRAELASAKSTHEFFARFKF